MIANLKNSLFTYSNKGVVSRLATPICLVLAATIWAKMVVNGQIKCFVLFEDKMKFY